MPCIDGVTVSDGWIPLVEFMRPSILWHLLYFCGKKRRFICSIIGKKFIMKKKKYMSRITYINSDIVEESRYEISVYTYVV